MTAYGKTIRITIFFAFFMAAANSSFADVITAGPSQAALYADGSISIGGKSTISGSSVAGASVSADHEVNLGGIYSGGSIWVARDSVVGGRVLANSSAEADRGLNFRGSSWTGNNVWLGREANVTGNVLARSRDISIDRNAQITGSIRGNGNIWIDRDSHISGNVSPGVARTLTTGGNVTIDGSRSPAAENVNTLELTGIGYTPNHDNYGSQSIWKSRGSTTNLDPGAYGSISLAKQNTLNLSAGTYTLRSFWMDREGQINIDTTGGDVTMNVFSSFTTGKDVKFNKSGQGDLAVNLLDGNIWFGKDNEIIGKFNAWDGSFGADSGLHMQGSIAAARNISLGANSSLTYYGDSEIPEPASMTIMILGGIGVLLRRRHLKTT